MNQKITLRFADHVLTFEVPVAETVEVTLAFRRRWPYKFVRANGDFHVHFDQVLWMKVSPTGEAVTESGTTETVQEQVEEYCQHLPGHRTCHPTRPGTDGGKHGSL